MHMAASVFCRTHTCNLNCCFHSRVTSTLLVLMHKQAARASFISRALYCCNQSP